jgi:hypothetical protein
MTEKIINSIMNSKKELKHGILLPDQQGIYAFFLNKSNTPKSFGSVNQVVYVGLSEKSLNSRDTKTHMASGLTGWSSLRRSLGAILIVQLNLSPQKRDKNSFKLRADKYKFDEEGEERLTEWMRENLTMGYWTSEYPLTKEHLRKQEEKVIIQLKPTLDLDKRTKKFNPFAEKLDRLREECRNEVKRNEKSI